MGIHRTAAMSLLTLRLISEFRKMTHRKKALSYIVEHQKDPDDTARKLFRACQMALDSGIDRIFITFDLQGMGGRAEDSVYDNQDFEAYLEFAIRPGDGLPEIRGPVSVGAVNASRLPDLIKAQTDRISVKVEFPFFQRMTSYQVFTGLVDNFYRNG